jgi:hypothetical protein
MSKTKRCAANFAFYDRDTIERKLEKMAADGWMLKKPGSFFWTYEKAEPRKLRFAVSYFPKASEFDPAPSEAQLEKEELIESDGWKLLLRWDAMQIFYTDREDAVPIDTDPVPYVENIHRTMAKKLFLGQLFPAAMMLYSFWMQLQKLLRDPAEYLSRMSNLFGMLCFLALAAIELYEFGRYFRWEIKARRAARDGEFLPMRVNPWVSWGLVIAAAVLLVLSFSDSEVNMLFMLSYFAMMALVFAAAYFLLGLMKKKGLPGCLNMTLMTMFVVLFMLVGVSVMIWAGTSGKLSVSDGSQPVDSYEWNGHTWDIYDDELPLEIEQLADVDARWSKRASFSESALVAYGEYEQDTPFTEAQRDYRLEYEITDVKLPYLYDFVKQSLINSRQDEVTDGYVFTDHYEAIDPAPWGADEAYQLHWSGSVLDSYLVCWEGRIVEIKFYWTPTEAQIAKAAEILAP